jgi:serine/threonine protein kinase
MSKWSIKQVALANTGMGDATLSKFAKVFTSSTLLCKSLSSLDISQNTIGPEGANTLAEAIVQMSNLTQMTLSKTNAPPAAAAPFAADPAKPYTLSDMDSGTNLVGITLGPADVTILVGWLSRPDAKIGSVQNLTLDSSTSFAGAGKHDVLANWCLDSQPSGVSEHLMGVRANSIGMRCLRDHNAQQLVESYPEGAPSVVKKWILGAVAQFTRFADPIALIDKLVSEEVIYGVGTDVAVLFSANDSRLREWTEWPKQLRSNFLGEINALKTAVIESGKLDDLSALAGGQLLFGEHSYKLNQDRIQGGMATVFFGTDQTHGSNRKVALKMMTDTTAFENERKFLNKLQTDFVVGLLHEHIDPTGVRSWLVLECGSETMSQIIKEGLDTAEKRNYAIQAIKAVEYLHSKGICHRDLKPLNMVLFGRKLKLIDFDCSAMNGNTLDDVTSGLTPHYCTPEVAEARASGRLEGTAAAAQDMWCLGHVVFEIYTSQPFFEKKRLDDIEEIQLALLEDTTYTADHTEHRLPVLDLPLQGIEEETARNLIQQMMRRDPTRRINAAKSSKHAFVVGGQDTQQKASGIAGLAQKIDSDGLLTRQHVTNEADTIRTQMQRGFDCLNKNMSVQMEMLKGLDEGTKRGPGVFVLLPETKRESGWSLKQARIILIGTVLQLSNFISPADVQRSIPLTYIVRGCG